MNYKMCSILNLNLNNEEANTLSEKICSIINNSEKQFKFMKEVIKKILKKKI